MLQKNVNEQVLQNDTIKTSCSRRTQCTEVSKWKKKMFQARCFFVGRAEKEDSSVIVP